MAMKKKINDSKKSKYIFVTLCIGCCALVILSLASDMSVGPLKYVSGYVITPIQKGLNEVGNWISDKGVYLQSNVDYAAQCKELQEKVDQLTAENTELLADREEKERLEKQLELSAQYDYDKVGARVIARDSDNWFNVFTIDKGSDDGIEVNNNVISNGGLVGIVTDVGPNYAIVRSIIDDYSNVSAMVTTTEDTCIIAGDLRLIDEGHQLGVRHRVVGIELEYLRQQLFIATEDKADGDQKPIKELHAGIEQIAALFGIDAREVFGRNLAENQYRHGEDGRRNGGRFRGIGEQLSEQNRAQRGSGEIYDVVAD